MCKRRSNPWDGVPVIPLIPGFFSVRRVCPLYDLVSGPIKSYPVTCVVLPRRSRRLWQRARCCDTVPQRTRSPRMWHVHEPILGRTGQRDHRPALHPPLPQEHLRYHSGGARVLCACCSARFVTGLWLWPLFSGTQLGGFPFESVRLFHRVSQLVGAAGTVRAWCRPLPSGRRR